MLFSSHLFIFVFLPATLAAIYFARRLTPRIATYCMILASIAFYYFNGLAQLPVLLLSILCNHCFILAWSQATDARLKRLVIGLAVAANLCALAYYKYFIFALQQYEILTTVIPYKLQLKEWWASIDYYFANYPWGYSGELIFLPLGLSFFTFQQIAYLADLQAGRVARHKFLDYVFCVTFFPHLVAGPIVNYRELIPQLQNRKIFGLGALDLSIGGAIFVVGLLKKVMIADTLASFVPAGFDAAAKGQPVALATAWVSVLAYTFQIYFDFSGYSDMAIGLARMFGFRLPINFYSPYKATSIIDFWRRWHMTLSRFLRQYVYIPLGGNRHGSLGRYRNLLVTMLIGGLWHGAAWTFVIWGAMHGLLLAINHLWRRLAEPLPILGRLLPAWLGWLLTFLAVVFAWVFFRASSLTGAIGLLRAMVTLDPANHGLAALEWKHALILVAAAVALLAPATHEIFARYRVGILPEWARDRSFVILTWRHTLPWLAATAALAGIACFYEADFPQFLYWNF